MFSQREIKIYSVCVFAWLQKEDPAKNNPRFWDELFLMKVSEEYLTLKSV